MDGFRRERERETIAGCTSVEDGGRQLEPEIRVIFLQSLRGNISNST